MIILLFLIGPIVWEYRATAPQARTYPAIGTVVERNAAGDSCIFVIGGQSAINQTRTNYEYDCLTNAWTTRTQMPLPIRYDFGGCSAGRGGTRRIYVLGGYQSAYVYYADLDEYTASTNSWVSQADMPTAREGVRAACVANMIYAIGGDYFDGVDPYVYDLVERYDPETNAWTTGYAAMPTARTDACCAVAQNENGDSCIYVFGGCPDIVSPYPSNAVEEYNPAVNAWRARNNSGLTGRWGAMAVTALNKIYVIGGTSDGSTSLNLVQVYDPAANTWSSETPIQLTRDGTTGGFVAGRIYVVVGSNGQTVVNTNERTTDVIDIEEIAGIPLMDFSLSVMPNPARDLVSINICREAGMRGSGGDAGLAIEIYDACGRLVKSINLPSAYSLVSTAVIWSVDDDLGRKVPAGVYFVKAKAGAQEIIEQIIILK